MTFRFPLQKVLDLKEREKDLAREDYGVSLRRKDEVQDQMLQLVLEQEEMREKLDRQEEPFKAGSLHDHYLYIGVLESRMNRVRKKLGEMEQDVAVKQHILMEKSKEEKVWQQWREQSLARHKAALEKQEQSELDELANLRFYQKQRQL